MIRFSAGLVVVAIGVLIGGVATSKLSLVYVAIAVSAVALVALAIGVALKRDELFGGGSEQAPADAGASSGMPVGQPADTGHVRGNDGHGREDQVKVRPTGPATAAFEAAAAAASKSAAAAPSLTTPPVTAPPVPAPSAVNSPLGQRQHAFSQASPRVDETVADWDTPPPQPPWSSGDQGRQIWRTREQAPQGPEPKESQSAPTPVASPSTPRGWGSSDEPEGPSWFDRLNQPVDDSPAPTTIEPTLPEPSKAVSSNVEPSEAESEAAQTQPSKAPSAVDADDDDWPTRYSWLDDDESDEAATPDAAAEPGVAELARADVADADKTRPAKTLPAEAKGAEPDASAPDNAATTSGPVAEDHAPPADDVAPADDSQPAESVEAAEQADMPAVNAADEHEHEDDEPSAPQQGGVKLVTVIPGVPRYHDPDCILIRFMDDEDVARKSIPDAKAANCTPCAACQPEG